MQGKLKLGTDWEFRSATLGGDEKYRYILTRRRGEGSRRVTFCMLNPSTADSCQDDPTIRRCTGFADLWGFTELVVVNLFALRSTDPKNLYQSNDPVGPDNDGYIQRACAAELVICAWGAHGNFMNRGKQVLDTMRSNGVHVRHLGLTKAGQPKHPLYLRSDTKPELFSDI